MNDQDFKEAETLIRRRVQTSARRYWWADREDMEQNGWRVVLEADRTFDPAKGSRATYRNSAMLKSLWVQMLRDSSPVSASDHQVPRMAEAGCIRAPVEAVALMPAASAESVEDKNWRRRLGLVLGLVADDIPDGSLGLSVLLGADAADVAEHHGVTVARVRKARTRLRRALRNHPEARVLHMQLRNSG